MEKFKQDLSKYVWSAIGGAVVAVVAGLWIGMITTSGSAEAMTSSAVEERDVAYCSANARKLIALGEHDVPSNLTEARGLAEASLKDLLPDENFPIRLLRSCARDLQST